MKHQRILQAFSERPWAITQSKLDIMRGVLEARAAGVSATKEDIQAAMGAARPGGGSTIATGTIALIPVYGIITQRAGMMSEYSGGCSTESYIRALDQAMADPNITAVMTEFDTPGGSVYGVPEAAAKIMKYRGVKPHWAMLNPAACSAGIWLAAQCERVLVTPSGDAGSVGVYMVHYDWSKWNEEQGVKPTYIFAAPYKVEGNPDEPLSEETRAYWQAGVDATYDAFVKAMARGRGVSVAKVKSDFGKGRVLMAQDAKDAGLVDDIAPIDDAIRDLAKQKGKRATVTVPAMVADAVTEQMASLQTDQPAALAAKADDAEPMDPDADGNCADGYEKRDDGMCYLMPVEDPDESESAKAAAIATQAQIDQDQLELALAESGL
jgi:signal peptide peptidase SppA